MNFYGHAFIAARMRSDGGFVFGAMLPDFEGMARTRVRGVTNEAIRDGIACHHAVDEAFHSCPTFVGSCARSVEMMSAHGVPRGPARAVAHVGLELVLDGFIVRTYGPTPLYASALHEGKRQLALGGLGPIEDRARDVLDTLLDRLIAYGPPSSEREAEVVTERLVRMLRDRPRLAIPDDAVRAVHHHVTHLVEAVETLGPLLIEAASNPRHAPEA